MKKAIPFSKIAACIIALSQVMISCEKCSPPTPEVKSLAQVTTMSPYETSAVATYDDMAVVAYEKPNGEIQLNSYRVTASEITPLNDDNSLGAASKVNVTMLSKNRAVVVVRDSGGDLKVIVFDIANDGTFTRGGDASGNAIQAIKPTIVRLDADHFATGIILDNGDFRVATWEILKIGSAVMPKFNSFETAGTASQPDLVALSSSTLVAGVRDSNGDLKLICYDVSASGNITRQGDQQYNQVVKRISMVRLANDKLAVFATDNHDNLSASSWSLTASGNFAVAGGVEFQITSPDTKSLYALTQIDAQYIGDKKVLLSALDADKYLTVIPFLVNTSDYSVSPQEGDYVSTKEFDLTYAAPAKGSLFTVNRITPGSQYHLELFGF